MNRISKMILIAITMLLGSTLFGQEYEKNFDQVYVRGTFNVWWTMEMELIDDHTWMAPIHFADEDSNQRFKFDIDGDWSENYGDNDVDGIADESGADIYVNGGGSYRIILNDETMEYSIGHGSIDIWFTPRYTGIGYSPLIGMSTTVYKDGDFYMNKDIYHYAYNPNLYLSYLPSGDYKVVLDELTIENYRYWRYRAETTFTVEDDNFALPSQSVEYTKTPYSSNVDVYATLDGAFYWLCSELVEKGVEAKVYKDGTLIDEATFESYYIYHGYSGCELQLWIQDAGDYEVVVDDIKDEKHYTGSYTFTIDEQWGYHTSNVDALAVTSEEVITDKRRTVIFIYGETQNGQDMFIRGGFDHDYANDVLSWECATDNFNCAVPMTHLNTLNSYTAAWKTGDIHLDWYGLEAGQGDGAEGTPLEWTTNNPDHGANVATDGYGYTELNTWGDHFWMLDVEMDCSETYKDSDGDYWFELKSYISNGPSWEGTIDQNYTPYETGNHFAKCGMINVFYRNSNSVEFIDLP